MKTPRPWDSEENYHAYVKEGYDQLAPRYDSEIGGNAIGRRMRKIFREALLRVFEPGDRLFEIGSGTGIDAIWLAKRGFHVLATDNSEAMVDQTLDKVQAEGLSEQVRCRRVPAKDIGVIEEEFGPETFDGGYCHAGALNMEPQLSEVPAQLYRLLKPRTAFVCSVINKTSLFESLFYPLVLNPRKGYRRLGNVIPIPISREEPLKGFVVPARFYSPNDVKRIFSPYFSLDALQGMQVLLPPANLADYYETLHPLFRIFSLLERGLSARRPWNSWGNHSILTLRRN